MRKHSIPLTILTIVTCWLAVLAGGDDFNFVRVALPFVLPPTPGDTLPPDDPNADFTETTASHVPARAHR